MLPVLFRMFARLQRTLFHKHSAISNARVDREIGDIDKRVDDEKEEHDHKNAALNRWYVTHGNRLRQKRTDSRPREQVLNDDRATQHGAELQADRCQHQHKGIARYMLGNNAEFRVSL